MLQSGTSEMARALKELISKDPARHAWVESDLEKCPQNSRVFLKVGPDGDFAYCHQTGHPSQTGQRTFLLGGNPKLIEDDVSQCLGAEPFLVRETPLAFRDCILARYPAAKCYEEWRMQATRSSFKPQAISSSVKILTENDAQALMEFRSAPPAALPGFRNWLRGATFAALFLEGRVVATASTLIQTRDVWHLVAIETKEEFRGRGFASQVISYLTAMALERVGTVTLTVLKDNAPAIRVYEKCGFTNQQEVVWIDNGTGAQP